MTKSLSDSIRLIVIQIFFLIVCLWSISSHGEEPLNRQKVEKSLQDITQAIKIRDKIIEKLVTQVNFLDGELKKIIHQNTIETILSPPSSDSNESESYLDNKSFFDKAFEKKFTRQGSLLLPTYQQQFDLSFSTTHSASDKVIIDGFTIVPVLIVGDVVSERIRRNRYTTTFSWRMGLPGSFQMDASLPWSYLETSIVTADTEETNHFSTGFGDLEIGLNYQLPELESHTPTGLIGVRWKTTSATDPYDIRSPENQITGSGFNTFSVYYTKIGIKDPLAFFGSFSFSKSLSSQKPVGKVKPGITLGYTVGLNMAINLESTIQLSFSHNWSDNTTLNGHPISGTRFTQAVLSMGLNQQLSRNLDLNLKLGMGLTEDSPDFSFQMMIPLPL